MPIAPGQVVNSRYQIIRLLGQGGFGAVYQAHDLTLNRPCALKENLETSEEVKRQFNREAQILANLSHPGLPRVTDFFSIPGQGQYLVMDYVEGEDLQDMLDRTARPLPESQALGWIGQVCDALIYLHTHQPPIIHRDVKPGNIRITSRGQAMLVDFGIAKLYDSQTHTTAGARAFTPGYSPPEQYGRGATDARSDIYALGATLYTLLTNQTPPDSVDRLTGNAPPLPPAHLVNPEASRPVSQAIAQAMDPERTRRFHSVAEFQSALRLGAPLMQTRQVRQPPAGAPQPVLVHQPPAVAPQPVLVHPAASNPSRVHLWPPTSLAGYLSLGLATMLLALLATFGLIWLLESSSWLAGLGAGPATPAAGSGGRGVQTTTPVFAPIEAPTLMPTLTPIVPPQPGAILVDLPEARIAFASDHAGDGKDRIYVDELLSGRYWLSPLEGIQYEISPSNPAAPVTGPLPVPVDETQERSWWPEWCDGNRSLLFEAGDQQSELTQTIYIGEYSATGLGNPRPVTWSDFSMLGVPRCANRSTQVLVSARLKGDNRWGLHRFDLRTPGASQPVGDGFLPFGGYASFSGDDSWLVLMHKDRAADTYYRLLRVPWDDPRQAVELPLGPQVYSAMYPSISPTSGQVAYACELQPETTRELGSWGLCLQDVSGQGFRVLSQLGLTPGLRLGYNRFHVFTPRWSADGRWLAYASPKDGDWDIYLYLLEQDLEFNLTQALAGDQFQPSWSKP